MGKNKLMMKVPKNYTESNILHWESRQSNPDITALKYVEFMDQLLCK